MKTSTRNLTRPWYRRLLQRLAAVFFGVVFGLLVIEAGLRIVGYSSPEFYVPDEVLGYKLIPNMSGWYKKEGQSFVQINSDGFRDVGHSVIKPEGTFRIAVIGDSYVEALQVSWYDTFSTFLAERLNDCDFANGKKIEILNFGVSGYSTAQQLLMMREKVWKYSPDLVLLVMTTNNDISDNLRAFKGTPIPYFVIDNDNLILDDSFRAERGFVVRNSAISRLGGWFKQNVRVVQGVGELIVAFKYWYNSRKAAPPAKTTPSGTTDAAPVADIGIDNQIYRPPVTEDWKSAWRVTEALITQMNSEAAANGAKFTVVSASNGVQVLPAVEHRTSYAKFLGVDDLLYPDRRIAEFCRTNAIPVITLATELGNYSAANNLFLHGFEGNTGYGHWNQSGHRIAGELIGNHLCSGE